MIDNTVNCETNGLKGKNLTLPMNKSNLKGMSNMSSNLTKSSSNSLNVYAEPMDRLDWSVQYLTDKHVKVYETCNKYRKDSTVTHFDFIAPNYEGMYLRMGYPDPQYVANFVHKTAKKAGIEPSKANILDLACGTGLVGKYLSESGFRNIVGVDVSPNMLEEASNKCVYTELNEQTLCQPEDFPDRFKNKFDFVTCAGLINNNHMDYKLFEEMLLSVKKGGYIVFAARFSYMGHYWYDQVIKEMHEEKRWKLITTDTFFKYDKLDEVSIGRFSKTPCKVFVFQKT